MRSNHQDNEEDADNEDPDLELLAQNDKLMDLILDISNELDINVLCHKILVNVCRLTQADRSSLFLARGPRGKRYLEAKLFDVQVDTGNLTWLPIFDSGRNSIQAPLILALEEKEGNLDKAFPLYLRI